MLYFYFFSLFFQTYLYNNFENINTKMSVYQINHKNKYKKFLHYFTFKVNLVFVNKNYCKSYYKSIVVKVKESKDKNMTYLIIKIS